MSDPSFLASKCGHQRSSRCLAICFFISRIKWIILDLSKLPQFIHLDRTVSYVVELSHHILQPSHRESQSYQNFVAPDVHGVVETSINPPNSKSISRTSIHPPERQPVPLSLDQQLSQWSGIHNTAIRCPTSSDWVNIAHLFELQYAHSRDATRISRDGRNKKNDDGTLGELFSTQDRFEFALFEQVDKILEMLLLSLPLFLLDQRTRSDRPFRESERPSIIRRPSSQILEFNRVRRREEIQHLKLSKRGLLFSETCHTLPPIQPQAYPTFEEHKQKLFKLHQFSRDRTKHILYRSILNSSNRILINFTTPGCQIKPNFDMKCIPSFWIRIVDQYLSQPLSQSLLTQDLKYGTSEQHVPILNTSTNQIDQIEYDRMGQIVSLIGMCMGSLEAVADLMISIKRGDNVTSSKTSSFETPSIGTDFHGTAEANPVLNLSRQYHRVLFSDVLCLIMFERSMVRLREILKRYLTNNPKTMTTSSLLGGRQMIETMSSNDSLIIHDMGQLGVQTMNLIHDMISDLSSHLEFLQSWSMIDQKITICCSIESEPSEQLSVCDIFLSQRCPEDFQFMYENFQCCFVHQHQWKTAQQFHKEGLSALLSSSANPSIHQLILFSSHRPYGVQFSPTCKDLESRYNSSDQFDDDIMRSIADRYEKGLRNMVESNSITERRLALWMRRLLRLFSQSGSRQCKEDTYLMKILAQGDVDLFQGVLDRAVLARQMNRGAIEDVEAGCAIYDCVGTMSSIDDHPKASELITAGDVLMMVMYLNGAYSLISQIPAIPKSPNCLKLSKPLVPTVALSLILSLLRPFALHCDFSYSTSPSDKLQSNISHQMDIPLIRSLSDVFSKMLEPGEFQCDINPISSINSRPIDLIYSSVYLEVCSALLCQLPHIYSSYHSNNHDSHSNSYSDISPYLIAPLISEIRRALLRCGGYKPGLFYRVCQIEHLTENPTRVDSIHVDSESCMAKIDFSIIEGLCRCVEVIIFGHMVNSKIKRDTDIQLCDQFFESRQYPECNGSTSSIRNLSSNQTLMYAILLINLSAVILYCQSLVDLFLDVIYISTQDHEMRKSDKTIDPYSDGRSNETCSEILVIILKAFFRIVSHCVDILTQYLKSNQNELRNQVLIPDCPLPYTPTHIVRIANIIRSSFIRLILWLLGHPIKKDLPKSESHDDSNRSSINSRPFPFKDCPLFDTPLYNSETSNVSKLIQSFQILFLSSPALQQSITALSERLSLLNFILVQFRSMNDSADLIMDPRKPQCPITPQMSHQQSSHGRSSDDPSDHFFLDGQSSILGEPFHLAVHDSHGHKEAKMGVSLTSRVDSLDITLWLKWTTMSSLVMSDVSENIMKSVQSKQTQRLASTSNSEEMKAAKEAKDVKDSNGGSCVDGQEMSSEVFRKKMGEKMMDVKPQNKSARRSSFFSWLRLPKSCSSEMKICQGGIKNSVISLRGHPFVDGGTASSRSVIGNQKFGDVEFPSVDELLKSVVNMMSRKIIPHLSNSCASIHLANSLFGLYGLKSTLSQTRRSECKFCNEQLMTDCHRGIMRRILLNHPHNPSSKMTSELVQSNSVDLSTKHETPVLVYPLICTSDDPTGHLNESAIKIPSPLLKSLDRGLRRHLLSFGFNEQIIRDIPTECLWLLTCIAQQDGIAMAYLQSDESLLSSRIGDWYKNGTILPRFSYGAFPILLGPYRLRPLKFRHSSDRRKSSNYRNSSKDPSDILPSSRVGLSGSNSSQPPNPYFMSSNQPDDSSNTSDLEISEFSDYSPCFMRGSSPHNNNRLYHHTTSQPDGNRYIHHHVNHSTCRESIPNTAALDSLTDSKSPKVKAHRSELGDEQIRQFDIIISEYSIYLLSFIQHGRLSSLSNSPHFKTESPSNKFDGTMKYIHVDIYTSHLIITILRLLWFDIQSADAPHKFDSFRSNNLSIKNSFRYKTLLSALQSLTSTVNSQVLRYCPAEFVTEVVCVLSRELYTQRDPLDSSFTVAGACLLLTSTFFTNVSPSFRLSFRALIISALTMHQLPSLAQPTRISHHDRTQAAPIYIDNERVRAAFESLLIAVNGSGRKFRKSKNDRRWIASFSSIWKRKKEATQSDRPNQMDNLVASLIHWLHSDQTISQENKNSSTSLVKSTKPSTKSSAKCSTRPPSRHARLKRLIRQPYNDMHSVTSQLLCSLSSSRRHSVIRCIKCVRRHGKLANTLPSLLSAFHLNASPTLGYDHDDDEDGATVVQMEFPTFSSRFGDVKTSNQTGISGNIHPSSSRSYFSDGVSGFSYGVDSLSLLWKLEQTLDRIISPSLQEFVYLSTPGPVIRESNISSTVILQSSLSNDQFYSVLVDILGILYITHIGYLLIIPSPRFFNGQIIQRVSRRLFQLALQVDVPHQYRRQALSFIDWGDDLITTVRLAAQSSSSYRRLSNLDLLPSVRSAFFPLISFSVAFAAFDGLTNFIGRSTTPIEPEYRRRLRLLDPLHATEEAMSDPGSSKIMRTREWYRDMFEVLIWVGSHAVESRSWIEFDGLLDTQAPLLCFPQYQSKSYLPVFAELVSYGLAVLAGSTWGIGDNWTSDTLLVAKRNATASDLKWRGILSSPCLNASNTSETTSPNSKGMSSSHESGLLWWLVNLGLILNRIDVEPSMQQQSRCQMTVLHRISVDDGLTDASVMRNAITYSSLISTGYDCLTAMVSPQLSSGIEEARRKLLLSISEGPTSSFLPCLKSVSEGRSSEPQTLQQSSQDLSPDADTTPKCSPSFFERFEPNRIVRLGRSMMPSFPSGRHPKRRSDDDVSQQHNIQIDNSLSPIDHSLVRSQATSQLHSQRSPRIIQSSPSDKHTFSLIPKKLRISGLMRRSVSEMNESTEDKAGQEPSSTSIQSDLLPNAPAASERQFLSRFMVQPAAEPSVLKWSEYMAARSIVIAYHRLSGPVVWPSPFPPPARFCSARHLEVPKNGTTDIERTELDEKLDRIRLIFSIRELLHTLGAYRKDLRRVLGLKKMHRHHLKATRATITDDDDSAPSLVNLTLLELLLKDDLLRALVWSGFPTRWNSLTEIPNFKQLFMTQMPMDRIPTLKLERAKSTVQATDVPLLTFCGADLIKDRSGMSNIASDLESDTPHGNEDSSIADDAEIERIKFSIAVPRQGSYNILSRTPPETGDDTPVAALNQLIGRGRSVSSSTSLSSDQSQSDTSETQRLERLEVSLEQSISDILSDELSNEIDRESVGKDREPNRKGRESKSRELVSQRQSLSSYSSSEGLTLRRRFSPGKGKSKKRELSKRFQRFRKRQHHLPISKSFQYGKSTNEVGFRSPHLSMSRMRKGWPVVGRTGRDSTRLVNRPKRIGGRSVEMNSRRRPANSILAYLRWRRVGRTDTTHSNREEQKKTLFNPNISRKSDTQLFIRRRGKIPMKSLPLSLQKYQLWESLLRVGWTISPPILSQLIIRFPTRKSLRKVARKIQAREPFISLLSVLIAPQLNPELIDLSITSWTSSKFGKRSVESRLLEIAPPNRQGCCSCGRGSIRPPTLRHRKPKLLPFPWLYLPLVPLSSAIPLLNRSHGLDVLARRFLFRTFEFHSVDTPKLYLLELIQALRGDSGRVIETLLIDLALAFPSMRDLLIFSLSTELASGSLVAHQAVTKLEGRKVPLPSPDYLPTACARILFILQSEVRSDGCSDDQQFEFFDQLIRLSGELLPISSSQRESHLHRQLKLIEENQSLVDRCLYLPSNPHLKIIGMFGNEAKLMQSAAKTPFLLKFAVQEFPGVDAIRLSSVVQQERLMNRTRRIAGDVLGDLGLKEDHTTAKYDELYAIRDVGAQDQTIPDERVASRSNLTEPQLESPQQHASIIFKLNDDIRQDQLAVQIMTLFQKIFHRANLPLFLHPYHVTPHRVIPDVCGTGVAEKNRVIGVLGGMIEVIPNSMSRHQLGRTMECSLSQYFMMKYGGPDVESGTKRVLNMMDDQMGVSQSEERESDHDKVRPCRGRELNHLRKVRISKESASRSECGNKLNRMDSRQVVRISNQMRNDRYSKAQWEFIRSLAAYSLASFLLQVKDRHNGNLMITQEGRILHIDFGFLFDFSPGRDLRLETAPFKLTLEMIEILGGSAQAEEFRLFEQLVIQGYLVIRQEATLFLHIVAIVCESGLPCFKKQSLRNFRQRLQLGVGPDKAAEYMHNQIVASYNAFSTRLYDVVQSIQQGIAR